MSLEDPPIACLLYIDGAARGNPGPGSAAAVVKDESGKTLAERGWFLGRTTNNVAEYTALVRGLDLVKSLAAARPELKSAVRVHSDSELLVRQIAGVYRVRDVKLQPLFVQAQTILNELPGSSVEHVPREKNRDADALANRVLDRGADVQGAG
jgi:ribonuclease HI